jgi:hypothetical protein
VSWINQHEDMILSWAITAVCVLATVQMGRQYVEVCTHIMNINDGIYGSTASLDAKNRASYLANLCFVSG